LARPDRGVAAGAMNGKEWNEGAFLSIFEGPAVDPKGRFCIVTSRILSFSLFILAYSSIEPRTFDRDPLRQSWNREPL
jgi:hypothetical protein